MLLRDLLQPMHLIVLLVICLLIFGPSKLADLGKGLGDGIRNFKSAMKDGEKDADGNTITPPTTPTTPEKK